MASAKPHDPIDLRIDPPATLLPGRSPSAPDVQVEMHAVLDGFLVRHPLEKDPGTDAIGIDDGASLFLVMECRGPEGGERIRVGTIEDDLHAGGH